MHTDLEDNTHLAHFADTLIYQWCSHRISERLRKHSTQEHITRQKHTWDISLSDSISCGNDVSSPERIYFFLRVK